jgi:histidine triad (HIT) family protein
MPDSVFSKIRKAEIPGELLYEDDKCFVILTIGPHNPGHMLVVPIDEIADWEQLPTEIFTRMMKVAQFFGRATKEIYKCPKVALVSVGFEVQHVHIHVFSLFETADIDHTKNKQASSEELALEADKIREYIKNNQGELKW